MSGSASLRVKCLMSHIPCEVCRLSYQIWSDAGHHCVCNYSCSVASDTVGLYCSVNRQDMKLDLVSVFCYSKRYRLRVKMHCNI